MTILTRRALRALMLTLWLPTAALAQTAGATQADLDALQTQLTTVEQRVDRLKDTDATKAATLGRDLQLLREDLTYLRVKLRRENALPAAEVAAVRDRLGAIDREASGTTLTVAAPSARAGEIAVGQELDARLQTPLSSQTAEVEDRFEATTLVDLYQGSTLLVPAGSVLRGVVSGVERASRIDRRGSLTLAFDQMTVDGRTYRIRGSVTQALEGPGIKGEVGKMTAGAAAGAIIGGILGGFQGAMVGIAVGGGGSLLALPGTNVKVDAGTVLRVRFDAPVALGAAPLPEPR
ncbi:hypothetical protein TBR22_A07400 [Luteitalea sp. TBR-22]|uniref:hypothetical protein n=1 Tax=Luteitalea sp. TBR-22 TaxID=2802971 RepID=UPI001AF49F19|nr:hypothetical protein [Luteitalea sp. TBR-22]BCS31539.1 hypothetical protein TBR22_A07400 [Luteitalea sp. TBR-22]